jgi:vancomycin resistance protein YoaR
LEVIEKPKINEAPSNLAIIGRYILTPKIMSILEKTSHGVGGEIQLTDAIATLLKYENIYAKKINGMLIQPNETFSLVTTLGKIDGAHGWKPELVIKGSKITPEFGGGLCQVATTLFRSALNAGLPIVERTNHSLRISYYEPPVGLDATIYEPKPDLRFTNNYSTPLLIQTEVKGTKLIFRLYGTKDGRTVSIPTPTVYNKVGIPATKYIEVDTLKPGETKCQKPGHPGADAIATYTVTYPDGTKKVQTFKSHYRAIGVICQVGKAAASTPTNTNSGS